MVEKVNLLIIGTQKAGTTSLYNYLKQHEDIYFSEIKEITYFVDDKYYSKGEDYYHSFFDNYRGQRIIASSCVHMLPCEYCPERVYQYNPEMKLIVVLRHPIDRAYSAYNYAIKNGWEDGGNGFMKAFELEKERLKGNLTERYDLAYFYNGLYYKHLLNWLHFFPRRNLFIIRDADLRNATQATLSKIFTFLRLSDNTEIDFSREYNKAGKARFKMVQKLMLSRDSHIKAVMGNILPRRMKLFIRSRIFPVISDLNFIRDKNTPMDVEQQNFLNEYFRTDLELLEKEFGVKL